MLLSACLYNVIYIIFILKYTFEWFLEKIEHLKWSLDMMTHFYWYGWVLPRNTRGKRQIQGLRYVNMTISSVCSNNQYSFSRYLIGGWTRNYFLICWAKNFLYIGYIYSFKQIYKYVLHFQIPMYKNEGTLLNRKFSKLSP